MRATVKDEEASEPGRDLRRDLQDHYEYIAGGGWNPAFGEGASAKDVYLRALVDAAHLAGFTLRAGGASIDAAAITAADSVRIVAISAAWKHLALARGRYDEIDPEIGSDAAFALADECQSAGDALRSLGIDPATGEALGEPAHLDPAMRAPTFERTSRELALGLPPGWLGDVAPNAPHMTPAPDPLLRVNACLASSPQNAWHCTEPAGHAGGHVAEAVEKWPRPADVMRQAHEVARAAGGQRLGLPAVALPSGKRVELEPADELPDPDDARPW